METLIDTQEIPRKAVHFDADLQVIILEAYAEELEGILDRRVPNWREL